LVKLLVYNGSECTFSIERVLKELRDSQRGNAVNVKPRQEAWKEEMVMSERILGRHTAELDEQGTLTLYGPGTRMALPYDEAYALLTWLDENHRDTLFRLVQEDQESELYKSS
jgi:hypothetical protein